MSRLISVIPDHKIWGRFDRRIKPCISFPSITTSKRWFQPLESPYVILRPCQKVNVALFVRVPGRFTHRRLTVANNIICIDQGLIYRLLSTSLGAIRPRYVSGQTLVKRLFDD